MKKRSKSIPVLGPRPHIVQAVDALKVCSALADGARTALEDAVAIARLLQANIVANEGKRMPTLEPDTLWRALNLMRQQIGFALAAADGASGQAHNTLKIVDPERTAQEADR